MKATLRGVLIGKPTAKGRERTYANSDGSSRTARFSNLVLAINELPEAPGGKVNRWEIPVFSGGNPTLQFDVQEACLLNREKLQEGSHVLEADVSFNPVPRRDNGIVVDERNSYGGARLLENVRVVPANDDERDRILSALEAENQERD